MPTTPKIGKDKILEAALQMVIEEGKDSINIKSLAAYLGCSTQPISWHFGGMEQLRQELSRAAVDFVARKLTSAFDDKKYIFEHLGLMIIDLAFDMPNLMEFFIYDDYCKQKTLLSCEYEKSPNLMKIAEYISADINLEIEKSKEYVLNMYIFTVGLVQLIISRNFCGSKQHAHKMLCNAAFNNLRGLGFDTSAYKDTVLNC